MREALSPTFRSRNWPPRILRSHTSDWQSWDMDPGPLAPSCLPGPHCGLRRQRSEFGPRGGTGIFTWLSCPDSEWQVSPYVGFLSACFSIFVSKMGRRGSHWYLSWRNEVISRFFWVIHLHPIPQGENPRKPPNLFPWKCTHLHKYLENSRYLKLVDGKFAPSEWSLSLALATPKCPAKFPIIKFSLLENTFWANPVHRM